jgi:hypothetical protein
LHALPFCDRWQPVGEHARHPLQPRCQLDEAVVTIHDAGPAEGHAGGGRAIEATADPRVEIRHHVVVLMQQVHEVAPGQVDGPVPVAAEPQPLGALHDLDPAAGIHGPHEP